METELNSFSLRNVWVNFKRGLKTHWVFLLVLILLGGAVMGIVSWYGYTPEYTASATFTVYVKNTTYSSIPAYNSATADQMAKTFPDILTSGILSDLVMEDLGETELPTISAEAIKSANLIELKVTGEDPVNCERVLQSVIKNYPEIAERVVGPTKMTIVDSTGIPKTPDNHRDWKNAAEKGAIIGAVIGALLIYAYGALKKTIMDRDDVQRISNATYLGALPTVVRKKRSNDEEQAVSLNCVSDMNYKESFRSIATRISKTVKENDYRTIMVCSAIPGEGKSTVSTNLALMLAKLNNKVLIIDCDLRSPSLYRMFNHKKCMGVTEYLDGTKKLDSIIYDIIPEKLDVIFAGKPTNDGAELLGSEKFGYLLRTLKAKYDVVILDTPPCSMLADATELASEADCAVMVIKQDYASRDSVINGLANLRESGTEVIGYIINEYAGGISGRYGYGYGYGYGKGYGKGYGYGYGKADKDEIDIAEEEPETSKIEDLKVKSDAAEITREAVKEKKSEKKHPDVTQKPKEAKEKMVKEKKKKESVAKEKTEEDISEEREPEEKKKKSKGGRVFLIIVSVLVGLALLLALTAVVLTQIGKSAMTDDGSNMNVAAAGAEDEGDTIRYKGKLYRYNDSISSILLMGIDDKQKVQKSQYGDGNQSDANVMAVLDPKNGKLTLISISRDSMCEIEVLDSEGNSQGTAKAQLALSYSYGDGAERSCELTTDAVSRLFYDLSIPAYGSIYMDGIAELVDVVGGVTITGDDGQQKTLNGEQARRYIQYRAHTVEGNNERMDRQSKVLKALVYKALASAKEDPKSIVDLYSAVKDNVTTNLNASKMVYLAQQATKLRFDGEIMKAPGESKLGAQNHAEYIIDEDALFKMILDIFYIPVEE